MREYTDFDLTPKGDEDREINNFVKILAVLFIVGLVVGMFYLWINSCNEMPCLI